MKELIPTSSFDPERVSEGVFPVINPTSVLLSLAQVAPRVPNQHLVQCLRNRARRLADQWGNIAESIGDDDRKRLAFAMLSSLSRLAGLEPSDPEWARALSAVDHAFDSISALSADSLDAMAQDVLIPIIQSARTCVSVLNRIDAVKSESVEPDHAFALELEPVTWVPRGGPEDMFYTQCFFDADQDRSMTISEREAAALLACAEPPLSDGNAKFAWELASAGSTELDKFKFFVLLRCVALVQHGLAGPKLTRDCFVAHASEKVPPPKFGKRPVRRPVPAGDDDFERDAGREHGSVKCINDAYEAGVIDARVVTLRAEKAVEEEEFLGARSSRAGAVEGLADAIHRSGQPLLAQDFKMLHRHSEHILSGVVEFSDAVVRGIVDGEGGRAVIGPLRTLTRASVGTLRAFMLRAAWRNEDSTSAYLAPCFESVASLVIDLGAHVDRCSGPEMASLLSAFREMTELFEEIRGGIEDLEATARRVRDRVLFIRTPTDMRTKDYELLDFYKDRDAGLGPAPPSSRAQMLELLSRFRTMAVHGAASGAFVDAVGPLDEEKNPEWSRLMQLAGVEQCIGSISVALHRRGGPHPPSSVVNPSVWAMASGAMLVLLCRAGMMDEEGRVSKALLEEAMECGRETQQYLYRLRRSGTWVAALAKAASSSPVNDPPSTCALTLQGHSGTVHALCALQNGLLASGSQDTMIKIWDLSSGSCIRTLQGHSQPIVALCALPGDLLVSSSHDRTIKLWDPSTGSCIRTLQGHSSAVSALCVVPNGFLASGSHDKQIKIWDTSTGSCTGTLNGHTSQVSALCVLQDGSLASGSHDRKIKVWDLSTGSCMRTLEGHPHPVSALCVLPDGSLAIGSHDPTIQVRDPFSGSCIRTLEGHSHHVFALCILPDGSLASGSHDKMIKIWDPSSASEIWTLEGHSHHVFAMCVLPGGVLASGSEDKTAKVWTADGELSHAPRIDKGAIPLLRAGVSLGFHDELASDPEIHAILDKAAPKSGSTPPDAALEALVRKVGSVARLSPRKSWDAIDDMLSQGHGLASLIATSRQEIDSSAPAGTLQPSLAINYLTSTPEAEWTVDGLLVATKLQAIKPVLEYEGLEDLRDLEIIDGTLLSKAGVGTIRARKFDVEKAAVTAWKAAGKGCAMQ